MKSCFIEFIAQKYADEKSDGFLLTSISISTTKMATSNRRSVNFSSVQTLFLVSEVIKRRDFIAGRKNGVGVTNISRIRHWREITEQFNARYPYSVRTLYEVRKKWDNFTSRAKKKIQNFQRNQNRGAGGI